MPDTVTAVQRFRQDMARHIARLKGARGGVVIFGTGRAGWYIMKVLEHHDIPIAAFCVSDAEKVQDTYCSYPVHAVEQIAAKWPGADVAIGVFRPEAVQAVKDRLAGLSFSGFLWAMDAFLFHFQTEVLGRRCDPEVLARSIEVLFENYDMGEYHYGYTKGGQFVAPFVTSVITQKCSLRCRDCGQLIPYYKKPRHFSVESVTEDLKQFAAAFDVVPEISLHGGEPFLYPELGRLCEAVATLPNIVFISFVTNGTLCPDRDTLRRMSACGVDVHVSGGYGSLSRKKDELLQALGEVGIYADVLYCLDSQMWARPAPFSKRARPLGENAKMYQDCVSTKICCQIMDGELHRCPRSMHGSHQGLLPKTPEDFVALCSGEVSIEQRSAAIRSFLTRSTPLGACDHCGPDDGVVPPAIQLPLRAPVSGEEED